MRSPAAILPKWCRTPRCHRKSPPRCSFTCSSSRTTATASPPPTDGGTGNPRANRSVWANSNKRWQWRGRYAVQRPLQRLNDAQERETKWRCAEGAVEHKWVRAPRMAELTAWASACAANSPNGALGIVTSAAGQAARARAPLVRAGKAPNIIVSFKSFCALLNPVVARRHIQAACRALRLIASSLRLP
jgi:hypothetical protein